MAGGDLVRRIPSATVVPASPGSRPAPCGPQTVRKKSGRGRSPPTAPNDPADAFAQVRPCFSVSVDDDQEQSKTPFSFRFNV